MRLLLTVIAFCSLWLVMPSLAQERLVSVDCIEGAVLDTVQAGALATIHIRITNNTDKSFNINNGFRLWSPDGAQWSYPTRDTSFPCIERQIPCIIEVTLIDSILFDSTFRMHFNVTDGRAYFSPDGELSDTLGYYAAGSSVESSLPPNSNNVPMHIPIHTRVEDSGRTICIDSSWFPPGGAWKWAPIDLSPQIVPDWSGIRCMTLSAGCCIGGLTGNIDYDPSNLVDIGDLTTLIGYLYIDGPAPPCMSEANVDGKGEVDIGDLTALIAYLYIPPNPEPAGCE